ncbi:hypothetical protein E1258_05505 [Micromonospora sp. KC207]|uniref:integrase core domain-containing protein n=1 Tax=Micromonospora sp. KC207 TaxID=2530377 RepID=UPI001047A017|nr:hypothetical protein E1258_05505 [Micromonospora sp. KC207]
MLRRPVESAQYTSAQYARLANRHKVLLSVGGRGQCWDNAVAESFFATIKTELLHRRPWPTRATARAAIFDWIEGWYNTRRGPRSTTDGNSGRPAACRPWPRKGRPVAGVGSTTPGCGGWPTPWTKARPRMASASINGGRWPGCRI